MQYVIPGAGIEVVDTDYVMPLRQKTVAYMRAKKSCTTRDEDSPGTLANHVRINSKC